MTATQDIKAEILERLLAGSEYASCMMPWRTFAPIRIRTNEERDKLIAAHIAGGGAVVRYATLDAHEHDQRIERVHLGAYCPRADGCCGWVAWDLDGGSHGDGGLRDPDRAAACIAERAANAGLIDGVLVVKSRSGSGRHVWLLLAESVPLADACLAAAALAAQARHVADLDAAEHECTNAFARRDDSLATPALVGAFEIVPKSCNRPARGYVMALPFGAVAAQHGGGRLLDVFAWPVRDIEPVCVPACPVDAWRQFVREGHNAYQRRLRHQQSLRRSSSSWAPRRPRRRLDPRTVALLDGMLPQGARNTALYYAWRDLVRNGASPADAEASLIAGAARCGLSQREALATLRSARRRWGTMP